MLVVLVLVLGEVQARNEMERICRCRFKVWVWLCEYIRDETLYRNLALHGCT